MIKTEVYFEKIHIFTTQEKYVELKHGYILLLNFFMVPMKQYMLF